MRKLANLSPERVFYYFEEISKIPRESHHEKAVSDYVVSFGKKIGLETYQDSSFNVILRKKASPGYEKSPGVIIQGHLDMVCEKEIDSDHDFSKDPIDLVIDGDRLKANKTTLGADNGIAIAMAMALLEDNSLKHGPLEFLATTSEEVDLGGALSIDSTILKGSMLINIDSEDEGVLTVGSAGGIELNIGIPFIKESKESLLSWSIGIQNFSGGHSGVEIHRRKGNANKAMVEVLKRINSRENIFLVEVSGGSKDNAIPRTAQAIIASKIDISSVIECTLKEVLEGYKEFEPLVQGEVKKVDISPEVIDKKSFERYLSLVEEIPTGVNTWMKEYPEIVESSDNLAIIKTHEDTIQVIVSLRSSDPKVLKELQDTMVATVEKNGGKYHFSAGYPEWKFNPISHLREKALEIYKKLYKKDMRVEVIHAGLECGAISQKYPHMDIISIGPNIKDVHTPQESLDIPSTERVYNYLKELLSSL